MIPKLIWQTHEAEYDDLELVQKKAINTWKNLNPGWNYLYVSKKARRTYIDEFDQFLINCYSELSGINQADLFKILVIYKYGGFYADMDSICCISLDEVVSHMGDEKEIICSSPGYQVSDNSINSSNFGAIANSKNFKKIVEKIIIDYKEILNNEKISLKNLNPGRPTWPAFNEINKNNIDTVLFDEDYFFHGENLKVRFDEDYPVHYENKIIPYSEFLKIKNLTI